MTVHLYFAGSGVTRDYAQAIVQASSGDQDFIQDGTIEVYDFGACVIQDDTDLGSPGLPRGCRLTPLSPQSLSASPDTPG